MGFLDFFKSTGHGGSTKAQERSPNASAKDSLNKQRLALLSRIVKNLGVQIENFSLLLNENKVTLHGQAKNQDDMEKIIRAIGNISGIDKVDNYISVVNAKCN